MTGYGLLLAFGFYITVGIGAAILDIAYGVKSPKAFFGLGVIATLPFLFVV